MTDEEAINLLMKYCGWYELYLRGNWEEVEKTPSLKNIKSFIKGEYLSGKEHPRGLYISGNFGTGKTTLMGLLAKCFVKNFVTVGTIPQICNFVSTGKLFGYLLNDVQKAEKLMMSRYLFLDDLGRQYDGEFPLAQFVEFMEYRYANYLIPTFVTSNLTLEELRQRKGYESIADRMNEDSKWMKQLIISGTSKRK